MKKSPVSSIILQRRLEAVVAGSKSVGVVGCWYKYRCSYVEAEMYVVDVMRVEDCVDGMGVDDESAGVLGMLTTGGKSMSTRSGQQGETRDSGWHSGHQWRHQRRCPWPAACTSQFP